MSDAPSQPCSKTTPETILRELGHRVEEVRFEYVLGDLSRATVIRLRPEDAA